jgi:hypothetical protein
MIWQVFKIAMVYYLAMGVLSTLWEINCQVERRTRTGAPMNWGVVIDHFLMGWIWFPCLLAGRRK